MILCTGCIFERIACRCDVSFVTYFCGDVARPLCSRYIVLNLGVLLLLFSFSERPHATCTQSHLYSRITPHPTCWCQSCVAFWWGFVTHNCISWLSSESQQVFYSHQCGALFYVVHRIGTLFNQPCLYSVKGGNLLRSRCKWKRREAQPGMCIVRCLRNSF